MRNRLAVIARVAVATTAILLALVRFVALDASSHSASDTLRPWLIEVALIAIAAMLVIVVIGRLSTASR